MIGMRTPDQGLSRQRKYLSYSDEEIIMPPKKSRATKKKGIKKKATKKK
jgi:hypothetical protein